MNRKSSKPKWNARQNNGIIKLKSQTGTDPLCISIARHPYKKDKYDLLMVTMDVSTSASHKLQVLLNYWVDLISMQVQCLLHSTKNSCCFGMQILQPYGLPNYYANHVFSFFSSGTEKIALYHFAQYSFKNIITYTKVISISKQTRQGTFYVLFYSRTKYLSVCKSGKIMSMPNL